MIAFVLGLLLTAGVTAAQQARALLVPDVAGKVRRLDASGRTPTRMTVLVGTVSAVELLHEFPVLRHVWWLTVVAVVFVFRLAATLVWFGGLGRARRDVPAWASGAASELDVVRAVVFRGLLTWVWIAAFGTLVLAGSRASVVLAAFVSYGVLTTLLGKTLFLLACPTRALTRAEGKRIELVSTAFDLGVERVRVISGWAGRRTNAHVVGVSPRRHLVLLTERLLGTFDDAALSAVLAHEMGHAEGWHGLVSAGYRQAVSAAFLVAAVLALDRDPGGSGALIALGLLAVLPSAHTLVVGGRRKRHELEADRFALARVGTGPMSQMLDALARVNPSSEHRTWWQSLKAGHPDLVTRRWQVAPGTTRHLNRAR
jgi:Zn-dependent protease with chaperone function